MWPRSMVGHSSPFLQIIGVIWKHRLWGWIAVASMTDCWQWTRGATTRTPAVC